MLTVNVRVVVKKDKIDEFKKVTIKNAIESNKEEGIARFDIIQEKENPNIFMLVEVYKTEDAPGKHKETKHYKEWRDSVESMMEEPRSSIKYGTVFTKDTNYEV